MGILMAVLNWFVPVLLLKERERDKIFEINVFLYLLQGLSSRNKASNSFIWLYIIFVKLPQSKKVPALTMSLSLLVCTA